MAGTYTARITITAFPMSSRLVLEAGDSAVVTDSSRKEMWRECLAAFSIDTGALNTAMYHCVALLLVDNNVRI